MKQCPNCGYIERKLGGMSLDQFNLFWKSYPRKVGKGAAEKVWEKIKGDEVLFGRIIEAVQDQRTCEAWTKDNGTYIPHPATWLNQKRWEDEVVKKWVDPIVHDLAEKMKQKQEEMREKMDRMWEEKNKQKNV